jgi:hypothetical protein
MAKKKPAPHFDWSEDEIERTLVGYAMRGDQQARSIPSNATEELTVLDTLRG